VVKRRFTFRETSAAGMSMQTRSRDAGSFFAMSRLNVQSLVRRVDLFTLKLFLTAIEEGQIGRAAAREHMVASAATRRIQELEELAGMRLLDRNAKGVVPSPAGLVVAGHARTMLTALDEMRRELVAFTDGSGGHLAIAAPRLLIVQFLAAEIGEFTRRSPLVEVELREAFNPDALRALAAGEVELAVYSNSADSEGAWIASHECRTDRLVAVVPVGHALASAPSISLETLLEQDIIGIEPATTVMTNMRQAAAKIGRTPNVKYRVSTVEAARSLVSAGLGIALQPACMLFLDERDRLTTVLVEGEWAMRSYRVGWQAGKPLSLSAKALVEQLTSPQRMGLVPPPEDDGDA
jgi:DNA-binding transcriptional LysR family regulator